MATMQFFLRSENKIKIIEFSFLKDIEGGSIYLTPKLIFNLRWRPLYSELLHYRIVFDAENASHSLIIVQRNIVLVHKENRAYQSSHTNE